tara:strand:+ start:135 stop:989 length:855 start_codon:yes stop_codon:yes gene_type:complete
MSPEPRPTRIIAVANQKGGVGKTTTTINLGSSMAEEGHRVLIVDLDPQANATTGIGVNSKDLEQSIYHVILQQATASAVRRSTDIPNLDFLPSSQALVGAEIELVAAFSREYRLKRALAEIVDDYDIVLIDCPPALGLLTVNALVVASEVLVPIQCEYYALEGLGQLVENVDRVKAHLNPDLEVSTIALVMYDARTKLSEQVAGEVRAFFGPKVCRQVIPRSVGLSEASSYGQPINVYDPRSRGAVAYRELAREVLHGPAPSGENMLMDDEINGLESGPEEVWT